eukprot:TRINITY_DN8014_c0_g1_i2.p1 TRINITY_DN8014_c0_g1~~TRINITY_DN8014_c0_g1_i2.p1  ORF type:complete len:122 (+),score=17.99 TRINITY_DN8014_c0_g1_i2:2-367(+)
MIRGLVSWLFTSNDVEVEEQEVVRNINELKESVVGATQSETRLQPSHGVQATNKVLFPPSPITHGTIDNAKTQTSTPFMEPTPRTDEQTKAIVELKQTLTETLPPPTITPTPLLPPLTLGR